MAMKLIRNSTSRCEVIIL